MDGGGLAAKWIWREGVEGLWIKPGARCRWPLKTVAL